MAWHRDEAERDLIDENIYYVGTDRRRHARFQAMIAEEQSQF